MIGGCPETLRCDMGTENTCIERMQKSLHELFGTNSSKPCFIYGKSVHNQRIEAWWSILRKHNAQFWMNIFHKLKDEGHFCGTYLDKCLIQFCFMELIQVSTTIILLLLVDEEKVKYANYYHFN